MPSTYVGKPKTSKSKKKKSGGGGGGFFGFLKPVVKVAKRTGKDIGEIARHTPGGIYDLGKAVHEAGKGGVIHGAPLKGNYRPIKRIARGTVVGTYQDFRHPLRRPGYTLLDALAALSAGAGAAGKVGAVSRASRVATGRKFKLTRGAVREVPKGHVRLYRGEHAVTRKGQGGRRGGTWYTTDRDFASQYGPLRHVDIPKAEAKKHLSSRLKNYGKDEFDPASGSEFELPREWSKRSRAVKPFTPTHVLRASRDRTPQTRVLSHKTRNVEEEKALSKIRGLEPGPIGRTHKVTVPKAPAGPMRGAQRLADKTRGKGKRSYRKLETEAIRERQIRDRLMEDPEPGFKASLKTARAKGETAKFHEHPIREINALIRGMRLYRPGYIPPNLAGAATANIVHGVKPKIYGQQKRLRLDPEFRGRGGAQVLMGGGISQAAVEAGIRRGEKSGKIETITRGIGESAGKITDRPARERAFIHETHKQGYKTDKEIIDLMKRAKNDEPAAMRDIIQIVRRAEPEAIKFSKSPGKHFHTKADRFLARNIFLYRWLEASTRYAGHTISHHPTKSALAAQVGKDAPDIKDILKVYPDFLKKYVPTETAKGKLPKVASSMSYSLWDSPSSLLEMLAHPTQEGLSQLAPAQSALAVALLGKDPFTGKPTPTSRFHQGQPDPTALERALFAVNTTLKGSPYMNFIPANIGKYGSKKHPSYLFEKGRFFDTKKKREGRLFPKSKGNILEQFALGGWVPQPVNPTVAAKMARPYKRKKRGRIKRKSSYEG